jgi:hypothetical protein
MTISSRDEQWLNAAAPIHETRLPMVTAVKFLQSLKATPWIVLTEFGILILISDVHLQNALGPISLRPLPRVTVSNRKQE